MQISAKLFFSASRKDLESKLCYFNLEKFTQKIKATVYAFLPWKFSERLFASPGRCVAARPLAPGLRKTPALWAGRAEVSAARRPAHRVGFIGAPIVVAAL